MKVILKQFGLGADKVMLLENALTPEPCYDGGSLERAQAQSELNALCIGRLAAIMVEKGICTIDEAKDACGIWPDIEPYVEPEPSVWKQEAPKVAK